MKKYSSNTFAVIGLGFGDEGKGLTVNSLCQKVSNPLVVRYSGGQQAGHTVTLADGTSHVFSNFGSGTLRGNPTYWSSYCTFDPSGARKEFEILQKKGFSPFIYIDKRSPLTTPFEKYSNQTCGNTKRHGTCGAGVGATIAREEAYHSILANDIHFPSVLEMKVDLLRHFYGFEARIWLEQFFEDCKFARENFDFVDHIPSGYDNLIFEGSQGLLLDQNIGFFPHVTRANTGTKNILEMQYGQFDDPTLLLVTRAFQTRHGNGPMTNEFFPHNIKENPKETNVLNEFQGRFRRSLLDLDLLRYGMERDLYINVSKNKELVVTCLDLVEDEYRYTAHGKIVSHHTEWAFLEGISDYLGIPVVNAVRSPQGVMEPHDFSRK